MALKERISSPLEAGTSILDAHHLPPYLVPALEHVSSKLAQKATHITLVAVRRDYQLPSVPPPAGSPGLPTPSTPVSSPRFGFASSPVATLRHLVRAGSISKPIKLRTESAQQQQYHNRNGLASPLTPMSGLESPRSRWFQTPMTPMTPMTPLSPPPMTPCTASSVSTTTTNEAVGSVSSSSYGMRLVYPANLCPRDERMLRTAVQKAEKKYNIGADWLSTPVSPSSCGLTSQLIHHSIVQNDILFTSEGLTLISLDGLYSLKAALSAYTKTKSPLRLEDAVDELRRLVLAGNGRKVTRTDLLRSYDWLSVSSAAIIDLDQMYKRAYGGAEGLGAISGMKSIKSPSREMLSTTAVPMVKTQVAHHEPIIRSDEDTDQDDGDESQNEEFTIGMAISTADVVPKKPVVSIGKPPTPKGTPKGPVLKLQTNFDSPKPKVVKPIAQRATKSVEADEAEEEDGDRTARPTDLPIMLHAWNTTSIDEILTAGIVSPDRSSMRLGPMTPQGYDDISPTTRGEWGFLMVDDAFQSARTVAVETC